MNSIDTEYIIEKLYSLGKKYECETFLILAKDNSTISMLESIKKTNKEDKFLYDLNHIIDVFIADTSLSKKQFQEKYVVDRFQLRRIAVAARSALQKKEIENDQVVVFCRDRFKDLYSVDINLSDSETKDDKGKRLEYGYKSGLEIIEKLNVAKSKYTTIHKAKGLEADAVLVVARTEKEMLKWLNMTRTDMKSDTDEMYRLGYVAFTRPRKVLLLACMEKMDFSKIKSTVKVQIIE